MTFLCDVYIFVYISEWFLLLWHAFCHVTNKRVWWWYDDV